MTLRASVASSLSDWIPAADLIARDLIPGATDAARRKWLQRFCEVLLRVGDARRDGRSWLVRATAKIRGTPIRTLLIDRRSALSVGPKPPPQYDRWNDRDHQRHRDTRELLALYDDFVAARRGVDAETRLVAFAGSIHPDCGMRMDVWCEQRKLTVSERTLRRYRDRMDPRSPNYDGNVDGRGRWVEVVAGDGEVTGARQLAAIDPRAWELFLSLMLGPHNNRRSFAQAFRFVDGEAKIHGWDWPSDGTVRRRYDAEVNDDVRVLHREGPRAFEAKCVPKIKRDYDDILAGEWWCLDGRTFDMFARVPDSRKEWRAARLTVVACMDMRSRDLQLDIRATECSDGYVAAIKSALLSWGAPLHIIKDNGSAPDAVLGARKAKQHKSAADDDPRIDNLAGTFGIEIHHAIPYAPWGKPLESVWRSLKEGLDRWMWSFWGGKPDERPEGQSRDVQRNIDQLPTVEQVKEFVATWLIEHRATQRSGSGTRGLSPNLIWEQYRAAIRQVDPALVEVECRRKVGPITKTARGFRWDNLQFGGWDESVWALPRGKYWLGIDPDRADRVMVIDSDGVSRCEAFAREISGATREQRREAAKLKNKYRRLRREQVTAIDYLRKGDAQQILAVKSGHAQAREAEIKKSLAEAAPPEVQIVRPDLVAPARRALAASAKSEIRSLAGGVQTPAEDRSNVKKTALQRLAEKARQEDAAERLRAAEAEKPKSYWSRLNFERGAAG